MSQSQPKERIPLFKVFMAPNVEDTLVPVLHSGYIGQGKQVEEFESKLKEWFDYPWILTLNSATSGLTLALRLLNLNRGDEVLCSPLTCFATTTAILANGLSIRWVDIDKTTCNICPRDVARKRTSKTKAIVVVHWGGNPVDLDAIRNTCPDLPIVEDAAHAFGAIYEGDYVGTHDNITVFSLQAIKHLTTGDGGLIFLPNEELYNSKINHISTNFVNAKKYINTEDWIMENFVETILLS